MATFEPQFIGKGQTRLTHFDDQILSLYAKVMSTRDIVAVFAGEKHWENLITLFDYPDEIRRVIYTTNAIESSLKNAISPISKGYNRVFAIL